MSVSGDSYCRSTGTVTMSKCRILILHLVTCASAATQREGFTMRNPANNAKHIDSAMTLRFHAEGRWRGAGDGERQTVTLVFSLIQPSGVTSTRLTKYPYLPGVIARITVEEPTPYFSSIRFARVLFLSTCSEPKALTKSSGSTALEASSSLASIPQVRGSVSSSCSKNVPKRRFQTEAGYILPLLRFEQAPVNPFLLQFFVLG